MRNWTVGRKLWLSSGVLSLALLIVGGVNIWSSRAVNSLVRDLTEIEMPASRTMTLLDMTHDGVKGTLMSGLLADKANHPEDVKKAQAKLTEMAKDSWEDIEKLDALNVSPELDEKIIKEKPFLKAYLDSANEIMGLLVAGKSSEANALVPKFEEHFEVLEKDLGEIGEAIQKQAEIASLRAEALSARGDWLSLFIQVVGQITGATVAIWVARSLINTLTEVTTELDGESKRLNANAMDMSGQAKELSNASVSQASAVQETATAIEEISSMVKKTEENAGQLVKIVEESFQATSRGKSSIQEMLESMKSIREANGEILTQTQTSNKEIEEIVRLITEIGDKTKVINDIVFQTKLLSFNASVEAARAGEHGKGFAVVAEEVGNLAQMSGKAAKEISDMLTRGIDRAHKIVEENKSRVEGMLKNGQEKVNQGETVARNCDQLFDELSKMMAEVNNMTSQITVAIQEQTQGTGEISKSVHLFNTNCQSTQSVARQTSSSAEQLLNQVDEIEMALGKLRSQVGKTAQSSHTNPRLNLVSNPSENSFEKKHAA